KYSLRATGVEPRVYTFVEPYGIVISSWYLTNSYAALALRSTISPEILDAFMKEDDITIAFPTQTINVGPGMKMPDDLPNTENIKPPMDV
ncbi:MAG: mechanosensitive ion channel family protein, partial [Campylobacteraceae bacterium]|nr:mechanosensitive ion channel family protein [Campylobacteraceae bacterium]